MKRTTYQVPELRDENDNIIQQGAFGKNTALANSTNDGWIDYVANDLMYLYNNTMGGTGGEINTETITGQTGTITTLTATTVKAGTVTADALSGPLTGNVTGDLNGNVTGDVTGNLTGNVTGTADKAVADGNGNNIVNTYVTKSDLSSSVSTTSLTVSGETSVPTPNTDNNSTAIATTAFVRTAIAALVDSAPDTLNTLNELATALGNDANFAATVASNIAGKVAKTGDTITGPILYDAMPNLGTELVNGNYVEETVALHHHYIQRNTAYKVGDVLTSPSLPPGCVIVVTQAGTTGSTEPDWATIKSNMGGG